MPNTRLNLAVIGAGLAGLSCAQHLQKAGCRVTVFEKARGPGGRMSTRRADHWQCDHGAQYFTIRDNAFREEVARWEAAGVAALWKPKIAIIGRARAEPDSVARFVGVPRMSAPAAWLAAGLRVAAALPRDLLCSAIVRCSSVLCLTERHAGSGLVRSASSSSSASAASTAPSGSPLISICSEAA